MKHWLFCLFLSSALWMVPLQAQAAVVTPDLFRLQVVAESDSREDQALKLAVRDTVLDLAQSLFADAATAGEAYVLAQAHLPEILRAVRSTVKDGCSVRAEVGEFAFPDRIYDGVCVPAGEYRALKITLGRGEGHNWWCVLYPTLCAVDESAVNDDGTITFYSDALNFLRRLFGGGGR